MAAMSDYLEVALLNATLRGIQYTSPEAVYVGLFTVAPNDAGGGTEVTGGGYVRKEVVFAEPVANVCANEELIAWDPATADWGNIVTGVIFDAATGGNRMYIGNLGAPKSVLNGDTFRIAIGQLTVSHD